jgi:hypothetical protein
MCRPFLGEPIQPPNAKCVIYVRLLMAMTAFQLLIAISAFVFDDVPQGILAIIFIPLLFCSWRNLQYTTLMMFAIVSIILYVMALVYVLGKYANLLI